MEAGPDLDAIVAEQIMGWKKLILPHKPRGLEWMWNKMEGCQDYFAQVTPPYSSKLEYAWQVVEKLRDLRYCIDVSAFPNNREWLESPYEGCPAPEWKLFPTKVFYRCRVSAQEPDLGCWISIADECSAESPAHAICLSASKAINHEFFGVKSK